MKKILITGASGFIGAEVCRQLVLKKYEVIAVVSPFTKSSRLNKMINKITIEKINLAEEKLVDNIIGKYKPYAILHLATHGVYTYQQQDEERIVNDNFLMTSYLLKYSVIHKVNKFINTGSVFEYGSQKRKVIEDDVNISDILNKYSAIKIATTALANSYSSQISVITLRPFTTYGPLEDDTRFITSTIKRAINNEPIRIVKDVVRDFVFINDVARAYVLALETDFRSGEVVNIASGVKNNLEKVAKLIKKITNSASNIIYDEKYVRTKESACWANIENSKKILNWSPKLTMLQGIKMMVYSLHNAN